MPEYYYYGLAIAEGSTVPNSTHVSVAAALGDAVCRVAVTGGRAGVLRSLGSVYAGSVARFLGTDDEKWRFIELGHDYLIKTIKTTPGWYWHGRCVYLHFPAQSWKSYRVYTSFDQTYWYADDFIEDEREECTALWGDLCLALLRDVGVVPRGLHCPKNRLPGTLKLTTPETFYDFVRRHARKAGCHVYARIAV